MNSLSLLLILAAFGLFASTQLGAQTIQVGGEGEAGYVFGELDIDEDGKASGTLESTEGGKIRFEGEQLESDEIIGTDQDGNEYELEID